eukprot:Tbor_TRINITY_DN4043_c0_g1::TRINITY_DN4043_c0_g1_i1::g.11799::m.11799
MQSNEGNKISNYRRRRQESAMYGTDGNVCTPRTPSRRYKLDMSVGSCSRQSRDRSLYNDFERPGNAGKHQGDISTYIIELERQNRQLRHRVSSLQSSLELAEKKCRDNSVFQNSVQLGAGEDGSRAVGNSSTNLVRPFDTEEDKRAFLTDVLSQIEVVVQAHKNKSAAEIQRYKREAEDARSTLADLRKTIQSEGMTLSLSDALLSRQKGFLSDISGPNKKQLLKEAADKLDLPSETNVLLNGIADDILDSILAVEASDDLPKAVHAEVKNSFVSLILHFSDQLVLASKDAQGSIADMQREMEEMKIDFRTQLNYSEEKRIELVRDNDIMIGALRDELEAYHRASASDSMEASLHQQVLEEYNSLLIEARREANDMRVALEEEKNQSAEVCLKLKSTLQRRNTEFEKSLIEKTEKAFSEKMQVIKDLNAQVDYLRGPKKITRESGVQAGEPNVLSITSDSFIGNVLRTAKDSKSIIANDAEYEEIIWKKTKDLLSKYGNNNNERRK